VPIFDQGYQHWNGALSGHAWRWVTIARHGVRAGMANRVTRALLLVSWLPAAGLVFVVCVWGLLERKSSLIGPLMPFLRFLNKQVLANPKHYRVEVWTICYDFFLWLELWASMLLILLVGPGLISQDLRLNALPLYFSRPLRRIDYFLGKLGVIAGFMGMMMVVPVVVAYVLGLLFSLDATIVRDTFGLLLSAVLYGVVVSVSAGMLVLALSALAKNSRYVVLMWLGVWFLSFLLSLMLAGAEQDQRRHAYNRQYMEDWQALAREEERLTPEERNQRQRELQAKYQSMWEDVQRQEIQAAERDWRPMVSYLSNLSRVGERMLGTNRSWESLGQVLPPGQREVFVHQFTGPRYPWHWSAVLLLGLFGLSACVLNFRVRSLDRLK
jgi:ABC-2 type transport system permease protein